MKYTAEFKRSAKKEFDQLPARIQDRIIEAIELLERNPFTELLDIKRLKRGASLFRVRVSDYRVLFEVQKRALVVLVIKIGHRREVYKTLRFAV